MITWLIAVAVAVVALWPTKKAPDFLPDSLKEKTDDGIGYLDAVAALAVVRTRLHNTDQLDQPSTDACNILMLGLVAGSNDE